MNRQNYLIHLGLAVSLIAVAAIVGQISRWEFPKVAPVMHDSAHKENTKACATSRSVTEKEPEVLVKFKAGVSAADISKIVARQNDKIEDEIENIGWYAIDDLDNRSPEQVAEQYQRLSDSVEFVEPNFKIELTPLRAERTPEFPASEEVKENLPNDPLFGVQWALQNIGQNNGKERADLDAVNAWKKTKGNAEIVVAVLDTGVDYTHQDLAANMWHRPDNLPAYKDGQLGTINDLNGFNAVDNARDPMDENGHGTHCAGIIGAEGDNDEGIAGINWNVQIMPLKFLGKGGNGSTKDAIESINYVIERKKAGVNVRVISASWGSTQYSKALENIIRKAGDEGILFIAAAGNSTADTDRVPHYPSSYKLPNIVSVAALDRFDALASFSNYGAKSVHVAAPGKEIMSTWLKGNYREASGTSMATPYVSGVAALVLAVEPKTTMEKLHERLLKSVDKLDGLKGKIESGGRLNAAKALEN